MARKFVVSPTKLRMYARCPAEYRLEYIDKLGRFYHRARAGFSFGNSLHRALESFHAAGGAEKVSPEALTGSLKQVWVEKGYENAVEAERFRAEGERILQNYHAADTARREALPEVPPPQPLWHEKTLRMNLSDEIALSGRVDRVDEHHDGALEIVDYKSGRQSVTEDDVAESLAMQIYQVLVKHQMPDRRVFATIVALRSGDTASHEMSASERGALTELCRETAGEIKERDWEYVLPVLNSHCPQCDYLPHCTRYWEREARRQD